jgi:hypothetical protein
MGRHLNRRSIAIAPRPVHVFKPYVDRCPAANPRPYPIYPLSGEKSGTKDFGHRRNSAAT